MKVGDTSMAAELRRNELGQFLLYILQYVAMYLLLTPLLPHHTGPHYVINVKIIYSPAEPAMPRR